MKMRGKWINTAPAGHSDNIICNICGYNNIAATPFCPRCGSKMDTNLEFIRPEKTWPRWRFDYEDKTGIYIACPNCHHDFRQEILEELADADDTPLPQYCPHCGTYIQNGELSYKWPDGKWRTQKPEDAS